MNIFFHHGIIFIYSGPITYNMNPVITVSAENRFLINIYILLTNGARVGMAYCRYDRVCRLVKLRISMIRTFSFGNISHITLYVQLEIV